MKASNHRVNDIETSPSLPLVSVIVPNYKHERYLGTRLRTIAQQEYQRVEIILLDDASPDNSREILRNFASSCEKVTALQTNEANTGLPIQQWIKGVSLAKGDYIWIAESDDEAEPEFLTELLSMFSKHPSAGFVYCDSQVIDEKGKVISRYDYNSSHYSSRQLWKNNFCVNGKDFVINYMSYRNLIPNVSAILFKSSVLRRYLKMSSYKYCADWELYNRILLSHDIAFSQKAMNKFRKHNQTTRWHNKKSYEMELKEKFALLKSLKHDLALDSRAQNNIASSLGLIFENRHKHKKVEALCKSVSQLDKAQIETFYLFGANDIAERVIDTSIAMGITPVVIDSFKAGQTCKGIKVRAFKRYDFSPSSVVVICSLSHQNAMQKLLEQHEFEGLVLRV